MFQRTIQIRVKDKILKQELKHKIDEATKFRNQLVFVLRQKFFHVQNNSNTNYDVFEGWIKDENKKITNFASW